MSGPLSLREARTKRQKAKVYKTSRSEFRSTLNTTRSENSAEEDDSEQGEDKVTRRKIMKVDEKYIEKETHGEGSVDVSKSADEEKTKTENKEKESENDGGEIEDNKTGEEDDKDEDTEGGSSDQKRKKDGKKDDESDDDAGNDEMKEGGNNEEGDQGPNDEIDDSSEDGEPGEDDKKSDNGDDKGNVQEDKGNIAENTEKNHSVKAFYVTKKNKVQDGDDDNDNECDDEEEGKQSDFNYDFVLDPYEEEFDIDDDPSIEEDYYEFLSQDGGSRGASENSFGEEDENEELEEVRGAG